MKIKPVRAEVTIYDKQDPIGKIKSVIKSCDGVLVLGMERSHAYYLRDKEGSEKEEEWIHRKYTSSWLQLEAGIANALGKDVFVLCEKEIYDDGIFDRGWNTYPVIELRTISEKNPELENFLIHLSKMVKEKSRQHSQ